MARPLTPSPSPSCADATLDPNVSGEHEPHDELLGACVAGRFVLGSCLGVGATAAVYEAVDRLLGQPVAVKVLHDPVVRPDQRARFLQAMAVTRRVDHPGFVRVWEFGFWEERAYCVMELLRGRDLGEVLLDGPLPASRSLSIALSACSALAVAHESGVVHRDIKPGNLFLCGAGARLKILDFGLARAVDQASISRPGYLSGTPAYLAPELLRGQRATERSDLYALGVVLFEMLAGRRPFDAPTVPRLLISIATGEPRHLGELRPDLPEDVVQLVHRLLERDPERRLPSAVWTERALRRWVG